jgi:hypothetical protein
LISFMINFLIKFFFDLRINRWGDLPDQILNMQKER